MNPTDLEKILKDHKQWLTGNGGERADLSEADLRGADLNGAFLSGADLSGADLNGAFLRVADLSGAKIEFFNFPTISMLSCFNLGELPDYLTIELMRRDAWAHPHPERFEVWSAGGPCPYQDEDRFWLFNLKRELYQPGPPEMRDSDLILAICKAKGWGVRGYLPLEVEE